MNSNALQNKLISKLFTYKSQIYIYIYKTIFNPVNPELGFGPHSVMVKVMDCGIVVSGFEFQSLYYVHFQANTLGKGMNPLILPALG